MAVRTYTQSQLNNNMSGTNANAIYYATHGGSGNTPVVYNNGSGNYASVDKNGNISYTIGGGAGAGTDTDKTPKGGTTTSNGDGSYSGSYDTSAYGYGGNSYAASLEALLAQQRAAAENAYRNSMARLESAWGDTTDALAKNLNSTLGRLDEQYKYNEGRAQNDANKSLREAYINYMMNKKNLNQGLTAMGLSGGATESSMAKLFNNYGNSRNNINTTLADNIAMLLQDLGNNKSQAEQLYNTQFADARNNYMAQMNALEAALASNLVSSYSGSNLSNIASYANALNSLNGDYNVTTPTQNTLATNLVSTTANNNMGSVTDYAKWKAMADSLSSQGATPDAIIYQLMNNGADANAVRSVFGY
jgi:hypothetical protein